MPGDARRPPSRGRPRAFSAAASRCAALVERVEVDVLGAAVGVAQLGAARPRTARAARPAAARGAAPPRARRPARRRRGSTRPRLVAECSQPSGPAKSTSLRAASAGVSRSRASSSIRVQPASVIGACSRRRWLMRRSSQAADPERVAAGDGTPRPAASSTAASSASSPCSTMSPSWNRMPSAISRHSGVRRSRNSRSMQKCLNSSPWASRMIARRVAVRLDRQPLLVPADRLGLLGQRRAQAREGPRLGRAARRAARGTGRIPSCPLSSAWSRTGYVIGAAGGSDDGNNCRLHSLVVRLAGGYRLGLAASAGDAVAGIGTGADQADGEHDLPYPPAGLRRLHACAYAALIARAATRMSRHSLSSASTSTLPAERRRGRLAARRPCLPAARAAPWGRRPRTRAADAARCEPGNAHDPGRATRVAGRLPAPPCGKTWIAADEPETEAGAELLHGWCLFRHRRVIPGAPDRKPWRLRSWRRRRRLRSRGRMIPARGHVLFGGGANSPPAVRRSSATGRA